MARGGFEFGPRESEVVDNMKKEKLEKNAWEFNIGNEVADEAANPTRSENAKKQNENNENNEKKTTEIEKNPETNSYETSVKKGLEKARETEAVEKAKNAMPNGETRANHDLEAGLKMAWP